jgi:hypothetical protein
VSRVDDTVITITITVINNRRFAVVLQCSRLFRETNDLVFYSTGPFPNHFGGIDKPGLGEEAILVTNDLLFGITEILWLYLLYFHFMFLHFIKYYFLLRLRLSCNNIN